MELKKNDNLQILNYVCTSDSDASKINVEKLKLAKILKYIYLFVILSILIMSFIPLFVNIDYQAKVIKSNWMLILNLIIFVVLIIDYFFRWITYPVRIENNSRYPLIFFPFTSISIIMILAILPTTLAVFSKFIDENNPFIKVINVLSIMKVLRLILLLNVIPSFKIFINIFEKQKTLLINVFAFVILMAFIFALLIYSSEGKENDKINSYWDALYFTFITITTIGYGDITPVTQLGRVVVIFVAILGIIIFAIPSGIIAGTFMYEIQKKFKNDKKIKNDKKTPLIEKIIFNTKEKTLNNLINHTDKVNDKKISLLFKNIKNKDQNSELCLKIKDLVGGEENIEKMFFDNDNNLIIELKNKNLIDSNLNLVAEIFNINISVLNEGIDY